MTLVERMFSVLTKPFSDADDLKAYSRRGFYLLGLLMAAATFLLWWEGLLSTPLSQSNVIVRAIYKALAEKTVLLNYIPDSYFSLAFLPVLFYFALLFWSKVRDPVGEATANAFFWVLNRAINLGEWCIEHRWYSFFFIIALSAGVAALVTVQVQRVTNEKKIKNDFDYWLQDVERFVAYNPFTKSETVAYNRVHSAWRNDFNKVLARSDGTTHPAICLNQMLDELYLEPSDRAWSDTLQLRVTDLNKTISKCPGPTAQEMDHSETRTWALINLLMARINIRLSQDTDVQSYTNYQELVRALEFFETVTELHYMSEEYGRRYHSDGYNGQGQVYSNALSAYLRARSALSAEQVGTLRSICSGPAQCAIKALEAYQGAGQGWERCSYQGKRELNNTTDLLLRIGVRYIEVAKNLTAQPFGDWTKTPSSLADEIERRIRDLMTCNSSEPFLSTFALTAAEGFAVCAQLRMQSNQDATADMVAAGRYLRLANSFEPQNVPKWDYSYFCFAVNKNGLNPTFRDAVATGFDGLPNADRLLEIIPKKCQ